MSDIKAATFMSRICDRISAVLYALVLNKYQDRLSDTEEGSIERLAEAQDITRNLGFFERAWCLLASECMNLSFFFMKDIDEATARTMLAKEKAECDGNCGDRDCEVRNDEENAS